MKSNRNVIFVLVGLMAILALFWFYAKDSGKRYDWSKSLNTKVSEPYGLEVFSKTLSEKYPSFRTYTQHTIRNLASDTGKVDYYAIGNSLNFTRKEIDALYLFVRKGNNIFLSYRYISDTALMKFGIPKSEFKLYETTSKEVGVNFTHPKLKQDSLIVFQHHKNYKELSGVAWVYLSPVSKMDGSGMRNITDDFFENDFEEEDDAYYYNEEDGTYYEAEEADSEEEEQEVPSYNEEEEVFGIEDTLSPGDSMYEETYEYDRDIEVYADGSFYYGDNVLDEVEPIKSIADIAYIDTPSQVICKRYAVGDGFVYILAEPLVLTNFYYSNDTTVRVAEGILSHFSANKCILDLEATEFKMGSISLDVSNTPLQYMLSKRWFKAGIYALLFCAILFIILSSFRKQRPIPVFNLPENKSIEQIKNIASVLYHDKDIKKLQLYLKSSYSYWVNENQYRLSKGIDEQADLDRLAFINRKDIWDAELIKEFQEKYNKLKSIYGN